MTAIGLASDIIRREAPKYATNGQSIPDEMTLSGLDYFVGSAILAEADKFEYLP